MEVLSERLLIFSEFNFNIGFKLQVKRNLSTNFLHSTFYIVVFFF